jgi:hypothetical protein
MPVFTAFIMSYGSVKTALLVLDKVKHERMFAVQYLLLCKQPIITKV